MRRIWRKVAGLKRHCGMCGEMKGDCVCRPLNWYQEVPQAIAVPFVETVRAVRTLPRLPKLELPAWEPSGIYDAI